MKYSYTKYDSDYGVQRNAKPTIVAVAAIILLTIAYVVGNVINTSYIARSPYTDSPNIVSRETPVPQASPTPSAVNTGNSNANPFNNRNFGAWPAQNNTVAVPAVASEPVTQTTPITSAAQPVAEPAGEVPQPETPSVPVPEVPVDPGDGGIIPIPQPEVPCLCGVTGAVNDTVDAVTGLLPVQLFN